MSKEPYEIGQPPPEGIQEITPTEESPWHSGLYDVIVDHLNQEELEDRAHIGQVEKIKKNRNRTH